MTHQSTHSILCSVDDEESKQNYKQPKWWMHFVFLRDWFQQDFLVSLTDHVWNIAYKCQCYFETNTGTNENITGAADFSYILSNPIMFFYDTVISALLYNISRSHVYRANLVTQLTLTNKFDTFSRTSVRVSEMNAAFRAQFTFQMLTLLKKCYTTRASIQKPGTANFWPW